MGSLITEKELQDMIAEFMDLHRKQPRTYPSMVLAHRILKLLELRIDLDERKRCNHAS